MPEGKRAGLEPALRKLFRENAESMPTLYSRPNDSPRSSSRRFCHHIHFHSFAAQPGEAKAIRQGDIESVDIDTLVESAVDGVETTDEPIETKKSGIDIKPDDNITEPEFEEERTRVISAIVNVEDEQYGGENGQHISEKKISKRELEREEEQRLEKEGFDAGLNSRFRLRKTSGNTAIIEGLMKLKRDRKPVSKETSVTPVKRLRIKDVDLNLKGKIIPQTEQFDKVSQEPLVFPENATDTMKMNILSERRKNRIKNFVLHTDDRDDVRDRFFIKTAFSFYYRVNKVFVDTRFRSCGFHIFAVTCGIDIFFAYFIYIQ